MHWCMNTPYTLQFLKGNFKVWRAKSCKSSAILAASKQPGILQDCKARAKKIQFLILKED